MRAPNPLERRPRGTAGRPAVPRPTSIVPYLRGVAAPRPQLSRHVAGLGDRASGIRPWLLDLALRRSWILDGADRGGPRVIREAGGRGRRGTTGLRLMVGAGLRAVGVQRRDAATAGRRRDGRGPEGSGAGRTPPQYYACTSPCTSTPRSTSTRRRDGRRPQSFGARGRHREDRGRAAPWEYLRRRACGGGFVVMERVDGVVQGHDGASGTSFWQLQRDQARVNR